MKIHKIRWTLIESPRITKHYPDALLASIRDFGIVNPVWVVPKIQGYRIVAGVGRWAAARFLKMETIPCQILTDEQAEYIIKSGVHV